MRSIVLLLFLTPFLAATPQAPSKPYVRFKADNLLTPPDPAKEKGPTLNGTYLDSWIDELAIHAKNWPVNFASEDDKQQALRDVDLLSKILDTMNESPEPNIELLRRAGFVNSMAHNLDVRGAAQKATDFFTKLLKVQPEDPQGNYMFGAFLGGAGKTDAAIPYLQKADSLGVPNASFSLGMAYLMKGDKPKSLEFFQKYHKLVPEDKSIDSLMESIRTGKVEIKHTDGSK